MDSAKPLKEKCTKKDVLLKETTIESCCNDVWATFKPEVTFHLEERLILKIGGDPLSRDCIRRKKTDMFQDTNTWNVTAALSKSFHLYSPIHSSIKGRDFFDTIILNWQCLYMELCSTSHHREENFFTLVHYVFQINHIPIFASGYGTPWGSE